MRPRKITIQAFGAYLSKVAIDFTQLYQSGLFLITGHTGAGKTCILDAMSYALYGRATGSIRDVRDMRCTAAPKDTDTQVVFEFELNDKIYKFERSIHIREKKLRAGGIEEIAEYGAFCCVMKDGEWCSLTDSQAAVKEKAEELLGFSYEQFSQVVVLPQGEFRKLLTANSTEKQKILEALFGTKRWQLFVGKLSEKDKSLHTLLDNIVLKRNAILQNVSSADEKELQSKQNEIDTQLKTNADLIINSNETLNNAAAALNEAQKIESDFIELENAEKKLNILKIKESEIELLKAELQNAQKADRVFPYFKAVSEASGALKEAGKSYQTASDEYNRAVADEKKAAELFLQTDALKQSLEEKNAAHTKLEGILKSAESYKKAKDELMQAQKASELAFNKLSGYQKSLSDLSEQIGSAEKEIKQDFDQHIKQIPVLAARKEEINRILELDNKRQEQITATEELKKKLLEKRKSFKSISDRLSAAKTAYQLMQDALLKDTAFHLSQSLEDGKPCPVCGALSHPRPAEPSEGIPDKEKLENQRLNIEELQKSYDVLLSEGSDLKAQYESAFKSLGEIESKFKPYENENTENLTAELNIISKKLAAAQQKQKAQPEAEARLEKGKNQKAQIELSLEKARTDAENAQQILAEKKGRLDELTAALPAEFRDSQSVQVKMNTLTGEIGTLKSSIDSIDQKYHLTQTQLAAAQSRLKACSETYSNVEKLFKQASKSLEEAALNEQINQNEIENFLRDNNRKTELEQQITGFEREYHAFMQKQKDMNEKLKAVDRPNIEALNQSVSQARKQIEEAASEKGRLENTQKSYQKALLELEKSQREFESYEKQYESVHRIFHLLNGENPLKTPIHQFILGLMLDDIVSSANMRLAALSKGQYTLIRSEEPTRGGGSKGLDLCVNDAWRGGLRSVNTLSGGEMFMASLSLAFGLADVVQSYSGGVRLDSIFIDEGFGSLDSETLDTAMNALNSVQATGRLIGIISHVSELRERIPARIEVIRRGDGTSSAAVKLM